MKTIGAKIDNKIYDSFLKRASENNMTPSDFLRQIIIQTLENKERELKAKTDLKTLQERLEHDIVLLNVSLENLGLEVRKFKMPLSNESLKKSVEKETVNAEIEEEAESFVDIPEKEVVNPELDKTELG
jgi:hypothetical protein